MRFLRKALTGVFLLVLTVALFAFAVSMVMSALGDRGDGDRRGGGPRERVFAVNVVDFQPQTISPKLQVFGEVQSARVLDIRPSVGGTITAVHPAFVDGGQVQAGDVLLQIDPVDAETALIRAQADYADATSDLREAERALELAIDEVAAAREQAELRQKSLQRQIDLTNRGVGTAAALESAELAASSAKQAVLSRRQTLLSSGARVDQAKAQVTRVGINVAEAERRLNDTTVLAGFSGAMSNVTAVQGGIVTANERIGQLIDPSALEVVVRVSTPQYQRLIDEQGKLRATKVIARLDVLGAEIQAEGTLIRESAIVGEGSTGRLLFAKLATQAGLRPGDFVEVEIAEEPLQWVALLPASALSAANSVLVLGEGDRLREEGVTLVRRQGDDVLVRARGLQGQNIVSERSPLLGAGIKVRALSADGPSESEAPKMVKLSDEDRAAMIAFIEANTRMPKEARDRVLSQLAKPEVPAELVERLKGRMGG